MSDTLNDKELKELAKLGKAIKLILTVI